MTHWLTDHIPTDVLFAAIARLVAERDEARADR